MGYYYSICFILCKDLVGTNGQFLPDINRHVLAANRSYLLTRNGGDLFYRRNGAYQVFNRYFTSRITSPVGSRSCSCYCSTGSQDNYPWQLGMNLHDQ